MLSLTSLIQITTFIFIFIGIFGLGYHAYFTVWPGPHRVVDHAANAWVAGVVMLLSLDAFHTMRCRPCANRVFRGLYFGIAIIGTLLIQVGYGVGLQVEALIWGLIAFLISVAGFCAAVTRGRPTSNWSADHTKSQEKKSACRKLLSCACGVFRFILLVFIFLLVSGAISFGIGASRFINRSNLLTVSWSVDDTYYYNYKGSKAATRPLQSDVQTMAKSMTYSIAFKCNGPRQDVTNAAATPIFLIDGSDSHPMADYYPLQNALVSAGRRVCIFDKPGIGSSDPKFGDQYTNMVYYKSLMDELARSEGVYDAANKRTFILIGWGAGGATHYQYAAKYPDRVHSLVFLDVSPPRIEWEVQQKRLKLTDEDIKKRSMSDIMGRLSLFGIIRGLAIPWGLMGLFVGSCYAFETQAQCAERVWFFGSPMAWTTQYHVVITGGLLDEPDPFDGVLALPIPASGINEAIPIIHLMTTWNTTVLKSSSCKSRTESECADLIQDNEYSIARKTNLTLRSPGAAASSRVIPCPEPQCNLGYYIYEGPDWAATQLLKVFQNSTIHSRNNVAPL
jgi:pimeloyl-ACP methyl ester carboxylesterase